MARLTLVIGTSIPSAATDGIDLRRGKNPGKGVEQGFGDGELDGMVLKYRATVTAGQTATMSFLQLWVYDGTSWYPLGPAPAGGADTDRGKLNNGVALGEDGTDQINLSQMVSGLGAFTRVYLREGTSGGSGYTSSAELVWPR